MVYLKHTWSHKTSAPQIYLNLNVNRSHLGCDRSHILELEYGMIKWKIFIFMWKLLRKCNKNKITTKFVGQWGGSDLDDGFTMFAFDIRVFV